MDPLQELLEMARAAIAAGADADSVDARVSKVTEGRFKTLAELERGLRKPMSVGDVARAGAQGASFGFFDEARGVGAAIVPGGKGYTEARDESRANMARIRHDHPLGSFVAEMAGGMVAPGLGGAAVGSKMLAGGASRVAAGAAGGAVGGAAGGALTGVGEGETLWGRVRGGLAGGAVGAAAGAGLGAAGGYLARRMNPGVDRARQRLVEELERAGVDPEQLLTHLRQVGPEAVPADLGENMAREARAALNQAPDLAAPGGPKSRIRSRAARTGDRLARDLREGSGLSKRYVESLRGAESALEDLRAEVYKPLEELYGRVEHPRVREAIELPEVQAVLSETSPGVVQGKKAPSFMELQRAMFRLDDKAKSATAGREYQLAREATAAKNKLIAAMEEAMPEFEGAQQKYAQALQRVGAHELGRKMWGRPSSDILAELNSMTTPEAQEAFRYGLLDAVETRLLRRKGGNPASGELIDAGADVLKKLRVLMGSDEGLAALQRSTEREGLYRATWQALNGNSTTAQQVNDIFAQMPANRTQFIRKMLEIVGGTREDRLAAARVLGQVLLAEGEDAAERVARLMATRPTWRGGVGTVPGAMGGMFGEAAGRQVAMPPEPVDLTLWYGGEKPDTTRGGVLR